MSLGDFSYRAAGGDKVFISWKGRQVTVLAGMKAVAFLRKAEDLDENGRQQLMARVTGNFKRGNEHDKGAGHP